MREPNDRLAAGLNGFDEGESELCEKIIMTRYDSDDETAFKGEARRHDEDEGTSGAWYHLRRERRGVERCGLWLKVESAESPCSDSPQIK